MPVRVLCPHCRAPCLVAEQHLGVPVQCGRCARTFTTRADAAPAPLVRLDIGAATSPGQMRQDNGDSFLVRQLSWCNLDERHELAALAVAGGRDGAMIRTASTALVPLLDKILNGTVKDASGIPEAIAVALRGADRAALAVIWDGQVHVGHVGDCRVYHQRAGRLTQGTPPLKLAAEDWLLVISANLDAAALQAEISRASSSAVRLARQLVECSGQTVVAVRCY